MNKYHKVHRIELKNSTKLMIIKIMLTENIVTYRY